jgi:hypothetical protein
VKEIDNPAFLPEVTYIEAIEEPMVKAFVITPNEFIGDIMNLISEKRGAVDHTETLDTRRVMLTSRIPLNEILIDFHDRIKSITRGYGSMDYETCGYEVSDMVKLDMLVNGESVDAFSCIVHRSKAEARGTCPGREAQGSHPAAAVPGRHPGRHRRQDHRPRNHQRPTQGRHRQVLRRRHQPQAQAPGEAEGGQEAHEVHRVRQHPAGSLHRGAQGLSSASPRIIPCRVQPRPCLPPSRMPCRPGGFVCA